MSRVKLNDVDALFFGDDEVDRAFLGDTLIWNGDTVPELAASQDAWFDWSSYSTTELTNLGTAGSGFDLPTNDIPESQANTKIWPGLVPGDFAYSYKGEIDPAIGVDPLNHERLVLQYPYLYTTNISGFTLVNEGTEGTSNNLIGEATSTVSQGTDKYAIYFPGVNTNYMSVPDNNNLDLTTSMEFTMRLSLYDTDNRTGNQRILAKSGSARAYEIWLGYDSVHATINFAPNGASTALTATEKLFFLPEHIYWLRITYSTTNGAKFYWAPDANSNTEPSTWTQFGNTVTTTNAASVANAETLKIGTLSGAVDMFKGRIYRLLIRNAETAGTTVLDIKCETDITAMTPGVTTTFTATSGQTVTLTKSGAIYNNTVHVEQPYSYGTAGEHRWARNITNTAYIASVPEQLQIIWIDATVGAYNSNGRPNIYPVITGCKNTSVPYGDNSWGMYFDILRGEMYFTMQIGAGNATDEFFSAGQGVAVGSGRFIFTVALIEHDGTTRAYLVKYNPLTHTFTWDTSGGTNPSLKFLNGVDLIPNANANLVVWQGMGGFTINQVGIANIPNVCFEDESISWNTSADVHLDRIVEPTLRVVALGESPTYTVGDTWRANADGEMGIATDAVDEGDLFAVKTTSPLTFQQIKLNHPSRRKALYRSRFTTFGYTPTPLTVSATEDFLIWIVLSADSTDNANDNFDQYGTYSNGPDAYMGMETWSNGAGNWNLYMEIVDDDGNDGWNTRRTADGCPNLFQHGFSSPSLWAMWIDRGDSSWNGWMYDAENGLFNLTNRETQPMTGTLTFDQLDFFGPDLDEGYRDTLIWGGGWNYGVGIAPPNTDYLVELWERTVYGYPQS